MDPSSEFRQSQQDIEAVRTRCVALRRVKRVVCIIVVFGLFARLIIVSFVSP